MVVPVRTGGDKQRNSGWASDSRIDYEDKTGSEQNDQPDYEWTAPLRWSSELRLHPKGLLGGP